MASGNKSILRVESLDERCAPAGVTPANGQEFGTGTPAYLQELRAQGLNLGDICSQEKAECAAETLAFLQPPGHR